MQLLTSHLSENSTLVAKVSAACAIAHITAAERAKHAAIEVNVIPQLVEALGCPVRSLVKMAVRALRNIASIDAGRKAVYTPSVQRLIALLDSRPPDNQLRYDAIKALACIASIDKDAQKMIREHEAVVKLKGLSNPPEEVQLAAEGLRDQLRPDAKAYFVSLWSGHN